MTLTRADLVETAIKELGLSRSDIEKLVLEVLREITGVLAQGAPVKEFLCPTKARAHRS